MSDCPCRVKGSHDPSCSLHGLGERGKKQEARRSAPKRRKGLRKETDAHKEKRERWAFIKRCMIEAQRKTLGHTQCMFCGAVNPPRLDLAHLVAAGQGGAWEPSNAALICRGPGTNDCHSQYDGLLPKWSKSA